LTDVSGYTATGSLTGEATPRSVEIGLDGPPRHESRLGWSGERDAEDTRTSSISGSATPSRCTFRPDRALQFGRLLIGIDRY
jgi:hypothetical protein